MKFSLPKIKLPKFPKRLTSRKLWLAVISAVFPVFNQHLGWGFDEEVVMRFMAGLWTFILAEGVADTAARLK